MATIYRAEHFGICRVYEGNRERLLEPHLQLRRFADAYAWGYVGMGPLQLALAILVDAFDEHVAVKHCHAFRQRAIATRSKDAPFQMTADEVRRVVAEIEQ